MKELSIKDKELYLNIFCDLVMVDMHDLEEDLGDDAMWEYQIQILEHEDPKKYADRIRELREILDKSAQKRVERQSKIDVLNEERLIYERHLKEIRFQFGTLEEGNG